jgi:hypothetical protein
MYPDNDDWGLDAPWLDDDDSDIEPDYDDIVDEIRLNQLQNKKTNDTTTKTNQQN